MINKTPNKYSEKSEIEFQKEKWIYSNIVIQYLPYFITLLLGIFIENFNFKSIVINGDFIITAFSLSTMTIFELFNSQDDKNSNKRLRFFVVCIIICITEAIIYAGIKFSVRGFGLLLLLTFLTNVASIIFSVAANFYIIDVKNSN